MWEINRVVAFNKNHLFLFRLKLRDVLLDEMNIH